MISMNPFDEFDDIFADMDSPDAADCGADTTYDQLNELLAEHRHPFVRTSANTWIGIPISHGYDYASIAIEADEKCAAFHIDSGIRVPADKAREANKLVLLANNRFKLSGFDRLGREGGAVTFSYKLPYSRLGIAAGGADAWLTADEDGETNELDQCFGLATSTIRDYTAKFNAIIFGGASAVDARSIK